MRTLSGGHKNVDRTNERYVVKRYPLAVSEQQKSGEWAVFTNNRMLLGLGRTEMEAWDDAMRVTKEQTL